MLQLIGVARKKIVRHEQAAVFSRCDSELAGEAEHIRRPGLRSAGLGRTAIDADGTGGFLSGTNRNGITRNGDVPAKLVIGMSVRRLEVGTLTPVRAVPRKDICRPCLRGATV